MSAGGRGDGEVVVIGAGLAGLVAALRLAQSGRRVRVLAKGVGATHLSGGTIDVLGYTPDLVCSPAEALPGFVADHPDHPYARIGTDVVAEAASWFKGQLGSVRYVGELTRNFLLPTAVGAAKPTALAPLTMAGGDLAAGGRFAIVGLAALKDFYPALVAANLAGADPGGATVAARSISLDVGGGEHADVSPLAFARQFEQVEFRALFADRLGRQLATDEVVGLPAVLGLAGVEGVWEELEARLGRPVFEIPTLPPSVPGIRLYQALASALREAGARLVMGAEVLRAEADGRRVAAVVAEVANGSRSYPATSVVLASGGWLAGGIDMDSHWTVRERALGLPVAGVPVSGPRFLAGYLDHQPLSRAGVAVDRALRPVDGDGSVVYENVRVAGATLGGAEPWREKSGNGLSLASGYLAAASILSEED